MLEEKIERNALEAMPEEYQQLFGSRIDDSSRLRDRRAAPVCEGYAIDCPN